MSNNDKNQDSEIIHEFDGIQEANNPMPKWWMWLFQITIVWGAWYGAYYYAYGLAIKEATGQDNPLAWSDSELQKDLQKYKVKDTLNYEKLTPEQVAAFVKEPKNAARGAGLYAQNCAACHGDKAQGTVGPNLTDNAWIHGGSTHEITTLLLNGAAEKGMPGFRTTLGLKKVYSIAAYIKSVQGSNPAGAKAAEGQVYTGKD